MKWIKRKIRDWLNEPCENEISKGIGIDIVSSREIDRPDTDPVLSFRIYGAENGQVLKFNSYDRAKDRHRNSVYIINKDEDIAEKVAKCVTLETMK
jgi:hypothetical protein